MVEITQCGYQKFICDHVKGLRCSREHCMEVLSELDAQDGSSVEFRMECSKNR